MKKRRRLDPLTTARLKRGARCPDCSSTVTVQLDDGGGYRVQVAHDDDCPTLSAKRAAGATRQHGLVGGAFGEDVYAIAQLGSAMVLRRGMYGETPR